METGTIVLVGIGGLAALGVVYMIGQSSGQQSAIANQSASGSNYQNQQQNNDAALLGGAIRGFIGGIGDAISSSNRNTGGNTSNPTGTSGSYNNMGQYMPYGNLGSFGFPTPYRA